MQSFFFIKRDYLASHFSSGILSRSVILSLFSTSPNLHSGNHSAQAMCTHLSPEDFIAPPVVGHRAQGGFTPENHAMFSNKKFKNSIVNFTKNCKTNSLLQSSSISNSFWNLKKNEAFAFSFLRDWICCTMYQRQTKCKNRELFLTVCIFTPHAVPGVGRQILEPIAGEMYAQIASITEQQIVPVLRILSTTYVAGSVLLVDDVIVARGRRIEWL